MGPPSSIHVVIKQCTRCYRFAADGDDKARPCPHTADLPSTHYMCQGIVVVVDRPDIEAAFRLGGDQVLRVPSRKS